MANSKLPRENLSTGKISTEEVPLTLIAYHGSKASREVVPTLRLRKNA